MDLAHRQEDSGEEEPLYTNTGDEESIPGHLNQVAGLAGKFVGELAFHNKAEGEKWGFLAGLWHDLGKYSREFQRYIRREISGRYDHSTAGAVHAIAQLPIAGDLLAYTLAGHHGGMPNGTTLFGDRIRKELPAWEPYAPDAVLNPGTGPLAPFIQPLQNTAHYDLGFAMAMQVRMVFSALVDADFLKTKSFMNPVQASWRPQRPEDILMRMSGVLEEYLGGKEEEARIRHSASDKISSLRAAVHARCLEQGRHLGRGIYRLNVPTGGGKTLSSLSFALKHASSHGLKRVIYVIPYTSIIDQTVHEFRQVFATLSRQIGEECVLAHHSSLPPKLDSNEARLMSENWDAPLIVTTGVQLFESLFANMPSRCRKIHQCANAVLIFDEAQTLPSDLLAPCLEAMNCLNRDYGSTVVLCTATQPAFEKDESFPIGWAPERVQSLLGKSMEEELNAAMRRVTVTRLPGSLTCDGLIHHYLEQGEGKSVLMIVNTTRHAQELFKQMREKGEEEALFHLSARMVPKHREQVLKTIRERLAAGQKVVLIATRVVEAGVDLSFPLVYRDQAGLDSLAQAAGRCNRHGELDDGGKVYSFVSEDFPIPGMLDDLLAAATAARDIWAGHDDIFDAKAIARYFRLYYNNRKNQTAQWDKYQVFSKCQVNPSSREGYRAIQFEEVAKEFCLIPGGQRQILLAIDTKGRKIVQYLLNQLVRRPEGCRYPNRKLRKHMAQYCMQIYEYEYQMMQQRGIITTCAEGTVDVVIDVENVYDGNVGLLPMKDYDPARCNYIF